MQTVLTRPSRMLQFVAAVFVVVNTTHADIYQWEYINPADPSQGKQQSTTLAPDGAGVDAVPGADFYVRNLTMSYLTGADLTGAYGLYANLTNADLSYANFTNTLFYSATLTDADFTGAEVRGADFYGTGITLAQLYSTASHQNHDMSGISLGANNLAGGNFAGQNLTNASFYTTSLTDADFTGAEIRGANLGWYGSPGISSGQLYSTASYQAHDLTGINLGYSDLSGWNFAGQNLSNADLNSSMLTDADFTGAHVRGARFSGTTSQGFTPSQLYATASYEAHNLTGIDLSVNDLSGVNFAAQKLKNADLGGTMLIGANFREADLTNVNFDASFYLCYLGCRVVHNYATLTTADLTAADARAAVGLDGYADVTAASTANLIWPDGNIDGLDLEAGGMLVVRDYDGDPARTDVFFHPAPVPPIPITVDQHLTMGPGGTLRMVFEADAWDSTISFAASIPVALGGTLELTFAADVSPATQLGHTFDLFDWTGVTPTGAFAVDSPYRWDVSNLYTTGEVTLAGVPEPEALALLTLTIFAVIVLPSRTKY